MTGRWLVFGVLLAGAACGGASSDAGGSKSGSGSAGACPSAVTRSIAATFPEASVDGCKAESVEGHDQFEVKITAKGGEKVEVDVAPDGPILQIEQAVSLDKVPPAVIAAFSAKYPSAKPMAAEKQTRTGKSDAYELAFSVLEKKKEATFAADGTFLEEE